MSYTKLVLDKPKKRHPLRRYLTAVFRDYMALWREFKVPLIYFFIATVFLGIVYGELHQLAYPTEHVPLIDRPYIMLQMMILESPDLTVPRELHLVLFWYGMPLLFVYIAARGAADFVRVFFDKHERQDTWMAAIASTYRQHVIVFGAGHVGMRVIFELSQMGHDVVVIDNDPDDGIMEVLERLRVPMIIADGRTSQTLKQAGLPHAISFVACTGNDHVNLEAIMKARELNPDIRIVARVWDEQFSNQIKHFMNVQTVLSSSNLAAPAFAGAALGIEITQTLRVGDVEYSMAHITVEAECFLDGRSVGELQREENMDVVLYSKQDKAEVQPAHNVMVGAGDTLVIFAQHSRILSVIARNRPKKK
jgi:voltage-gated potassium channel